MFNILLCDLFFEDENKFFANYADDTTPYLLVAQQQKSWKIYLVLPKNLSRLVSWFANNQMKANDDKCQLFWSSFEEGTAI